MKMIQNSRLRIMKVAFVMPAISVATGFKSIHSASDLSERTPSKDQRIMLALLLDTSNR